MAKSEEKNTQSPEAISPDKIIAAPIDQITLVDKDGNEFFTTKAFYEKQKDAFALTGVKLKE